MSQADAIQTVPTAKVRADVRAGWLAVIVFALLCVLAQAQFDWLETFPEALQLPVEAWFNIGMDWIVANFRAVFQTVTLVFTYPMGWIRETLHWLPWSGFVLVMAALAFKARGAGLPVFTTLSLVYVLTVGLWTEAMNSFALVFISVPLAVLVGFVLGVWGFASKRVERALNPVLEIAQTVPAFAYLLPILLLFGFGPVVGLVASVLFAFPPMVRNTILGLRDVPSDIIESGQMSGANRAQLFWLVRFPAGRRQILVGVNQTTMASLSMVIIASMIGGTADIGWEVLSTMRKAEFGASLVAGIVIALMAMILDRITFGMAEREGRGLEHRGFLKRYGFWFAIAGSIALLIVLRPALPILGAWPETWQIDLAEPLDQAIQWFILAFKPLLEAMKNSVIFFVMLPLKIGLDKAVSPFTWGFGWQPWHTAVYAVLVLAGTVAAIHAGRVRLAIAVVLGALVLLVGIADMPWPASVAILVYFGWRMGGSGLATGTALALSFLLVSGSWDKAMLSIHLTTLAVLASFLIGTTLGIIAAQNDWFSRLMRPINDTLQTMPPFVLLIPIVMLFKIGDFTALLAIISYAYVPAFRYAEHGLRHVSKDVVEAATCIGATPMQLLLQVKLPLALPNIMLGLNQTIMYGMAMLVIAALVGTSDLGQEVYVGLSAGNFGQGFVAGLGMAIIAITADRFCRAWQRNHEARLQKGAA
ncbi:proline/glycine betaine ABC transporter permease [Pelagibius sp. Alg239-R121]|uniref:ABC transporter permease n=1 Tax=Pelagibius sp. Alg239-R121 TaxID=2993448 RepID=UPI0024A6DAB9|nr:ABC transporter permease subunit [Pelagibius sp. Alg239-R121]